MLNIPNWRFFFIILDNLICIRCTPHIWNAFKPTLIIYPKHWPEGYNLSWMAVPPVKFNRQLWKITCLLNKKKRKRSKSNNQLYISKYDFEQIQEFQANWEFFELMFSKTLASREPKTQLWSFRVWAVSMIAEMSLQYKHYTILHYKSIHNKSNFCHI